ncbi:hypothetical protein NMG60_11017118 [Bertholletia excelsa]
MNETSSFIPCLETLILGTTVSVGDKIKPGHAAARRFSCFKEAAGCRLSFGDKDLDLRLSNPLHLRALLEDKRLSKIPIVLLHASYPFSKEASYLASVYPRVMFSIDGHAFPETFYLVNSSSIISHTRC